MKSICLLIVFTVFTSVLLPQQLNSKLQTIANTYQASGMSVVVVKNDSMVFQGYYGKRDVDRNLPVNAATMYRIASISKFITATTLMTLYDQGLFGLDDDVSSYLGFTLRNPAFPTQPITFRKLLSHTSSLRDGSGYDGFLSLTGSTNPPPPLKNLLTATGSSYTANMFSSTKGPGDSYFTYANINFGVIGTLIEMLSGERFDKVARNNVLMPLGITGSFNVQDLQEINNVAVLYRKTNGAWVPQADNYSGVKPTPRNLIEYTIGTNGLIFSPTGGLRITTEDLARIMKLHANNGILNGVRVLSDSSCKRMHESVWIYNGSNGNPYSGVFNAYAMGNHTTTDLLHGESLIGHPGEAYGLISDMYYSPAKKFGIVFMVNGAVWGSGSYSGWYNLEEDVYKACFSELPNFLTAIERKQNNNEKFELGNGYPNPFNPSTRIRFSIPSNESIPVTVKVYNPCGQEVLNVLDTQLSGGNYTAEVSMASSVFSSGMYYCTLHAGNNVAVTKLLLLK